MSESNSKREPRCVASWLKADPENCWLRENCKYFDREQRRCTYAEQKAGVAGQGADAPKTQEREGS